MLESPALAIPAVDVSPTADAIQPETEITSLQLIDAAAPAMDQEDGVTGQTITAIEVEPEASLTPMIGNYDYPIASAAPGRRHRRSISDGSNLQECCCCFNTVGRFIVCFELADKEGMRNLICVLGPCWPMCLVTTGLIAGIGCFVLSLADKPGLWVAGLTLITWTVLCLAATSCGNPGIVPRYTDKDRCPGEGWTWQERAGCWRPRDATFDEESQTLVRKFDHFCPWTGTAIGGGNMTAFTCFTSTLCLLLCFTAVVMVVAVF